MLKESVSTSVALMVIAAFVGSALFIRNVKYINVICFLDFSVKLMKMSPQALVVV